MKDDLGFFWSDVNTTVQKRIDFLKENGYIHSSGEYWESPDKKLVKFQEIYKELKNKKTEPPDPIWLDPGYLPNFEEANQCVPNILSDSELIDLASKKTHELIFDIECYPNYFLVIFKCFETEKIYFYELFRGQRADNLQLAKLNWVAHNFCLVGFNSRNYDIPMLQLAIAGCTTNQLFEATENIISDKMWSREVLYKFKVRPDYSINTYDLIEVAPLDGSLKIYGGRLHTRRMQDLPFVPGVELTADQIVVLRWYCMNDLQVTYDLRKYLSKEIALRYDMSSEYGIDLRSKSNAQIAEAVIKNEMQNATGKRFKEIKLEPGTAYSYKSKPYLQFNTNLMRTVVQIIECSQFVINDKLKLSAPPRIKNLKITIGHTDYQIGIGGLHSCEKKSYHYSDDDHVLIDRDVASYYPAMILNLGLYPEQLGPIFLQVFKSLVDKRLYAKRNAMKTIADSLKIVINGTYGKLNDKHSIICSPGLMLQVTLTGQLSLLMLIERLEQADIPVVSANTDGIVIKCPRNRVGETNAIIKQWEIDTKLDTEETIYKSLLSRDVNNYIAIKEDGVKTKGVYAKPGLQKNPLNEICIEAVEQFLLTGTEIAETVRSCKDVSKFVTVRTVKGGAVKDGEFLGKAVRWYYSNEVGGEIVYALSGYKVPRSENARPIMQIGDTIPYDLDYDWYIEEAEKMLSETGYPV